MILGSETIEEDIVHTANFEPEADNGHKAVEVEIAEAIAKDAVISGQYLFGTLILRLIVQGKGGWLLVQNQILIQIRLESVRKVNNVLNQAHFSLKKLVGFLFIFWANLGWALWMFSAANRRVGLQVQSISLLC